MGWGPCHSALSISGSVTCPISLGESRALLHSFSMFKGHTEMDPQKRQAAVDKLTYIATNVIDMTAFPQIPDPKRVLSGKSGPYILAGKSLEEFDALCTMLSKERGWVAKFSKGYIEKGVHELLNQVLQDGNTAGAGTHLDAFVTACNSYSVQHVVHLPVDGIVMQVDALPISPITLLNMADAGFQSFEARVEQVVSQRSQSSQENARFLESWRTVAFPVVKGRTVAEYSTVAEPDRARERAEEEWRKVVDVLRYFIFAAYLKRIDIGIGLRGDVRYGIGHALVFTPNYERFVEMQTSKSPRGLVISQQVVEAMRLAGVFALGDMLVPGGETKFTPTLLQAVHWAADALTQEEPANEFLSLVSCLETFLTREVGDSTSISNAVAVGVAWVLGKDTQDRKAIRKRVKDLYDKRSKVSHGGEQTALAKDLPWLRDLVLGFLQTMISRRDEFRDTGKQGLHEWIEEGPIR